MCRYSSFSHGLSLRFWPLNMALYIATHESRKRGLFFHERVRTSLFSLGNAFSWSLRSSGRDEWHKLLRCYSFNNQHIWRLFPPFEQFLFSNLARMCFSHFSLWFVITAIKSTNASPLQFRTLTGKQKISDYRYVATCFRHHTIVRACNT